MISLSPSVIFRIALLAVLIWFSSFVLFLILRAILLKTQTLFKKSTLKIRHFVLISSIISFLLFIIMSGYIKVSTKNNIASLVKKLKDCNSLRVSNRFLDRQIGKFTTETLEIESREIINRLADVIEGTQYQVEWYQGFVESAVWVDICLYKNNTQTDKLRVISAELLQTGRMPEAYKYYKSRDVILIDRVRDAIGAQGDRFGEQEKD